MTKKTMALNLSRIYEIAKDPFGAIPRARAVINRGFKAAGTKEYAYRPEQTNKMRNWPRETAAATKQYIPNLPTSSGSKSTVSKPSSSYKSGGYSSGGTVDWAKIQADKAKEEAEEERQRQIEKFKSNLNKAYKKYGKSLSKLSGFIPEEEARLTSGINDLLSQFSSTAGLEKESELKELGKYRTDTEESQRKNLEKLANQARRSFMSGGSALGTRGAMDSSAAKMYSRGIISETNKSRQDLLEQAKKIYGEVSDKEKAVNETHDLEVSDMDRWVKDQAQMIKDDFARTREALTEEMGNVGDYKKADLENLDQQNLNAAYQKLSDLENRAYQYRNVLGQWRDSVLGKISGMKKAIIDRGDFTAEELELDKPNTALTWDEKQTAEDFYDPTAPIRKKTLKDFLDNPLLDEMTDEDWGTL
jgi:hypothetical protein